MGACYTWASWGLFDVKALTEPEGEIQFGSPIFANVTIKLSNGENLVIKTNNTGDENYYIQSLKVNGEECKDYKIGRDELMKGGVLEFQMGPTPNKLWGIDGN